ncbi:MAG: hypothetical protein ACK6A7_19490, partial [Planctomycetota bacterium]
MTKTMIEADSVRLSIGKSVNSPRRSSTFSASLSLFRAALSIALHEQRFKKITHRLLHAQQPRLDGHDSQQRRAVRD